MNANDRPDARTLGRVDTLLQQMTLKEKAALCVGRDMWTTEPVSRLGIPSVWVADGPTGLRKATSSTDVGLGTSVPATCFPTESALAATWDINLVTEVGRALGAECRSNGVQVLLGPGVNLKRSPLCGRNFEYFSEDPVLSGEMAAAFIQGVQEQGVGTSLKHFVANEQETDRLSIDSLVDERSLRELYLRPFEIAVAEAHPWTVMCAYNRVNGTYCAENQYLLRSILEEEWGFDGIVVSDWGAVTDRAAGIEAGMHLQMPGVPSARSVVEAVRNGSLPEARLDAIVRALLRFLIKSEVEWRPAGAVRVEEHHDFARRVAAESIVLLKNDGNLLPLGGDALSKVAVIGAFAKAPRYQGAGSSQVVPTRLETLYEELAGAVGPSGVLTFAPGYGAAETPDERLLEEARRAASSANVAVVVVGLPASYEEEGVDRRHIELPPSHNAVVEAVLSAQPRSVVVLVNGSAVALPWAKMAPAILEAWLGGQGGGGAIADVLTGKVVPSGKLSETFPERLQDTPAFLSFPGDGLGSTQFSEGLFIGYRWYVARAIQPCFPFGHGLSYTSFAYDNLKVDKRSFDDRETLRVSLEVRNSGGCAGKEVVQLYVREQHPRLPRPDKELKAFAKVTLQPGETGRFISSWTGGRLPITIPWNVTGSPRAALSTSSSAPPRGHSPQRHSASRLDACYWHPVDPAQLDTGLARDPRGADCRAVHGYVSRLCSTYRHGEISDFFASLPLAKLVAFGVLDGQTLEQIVREGGSKR